MRRKGNGEGGEKAMKRRGEEGKEGRMRERRGKWRGKVPGTFRYFQVPGTISTQNMFQLSLTVF